MSLQFDNYTRQAAEAVLEAEQCAQELAHSEMTPEHLLLVLADPQQKGVSTLLEELGIESAELTRKLEDSLSEMFRGRRAGTGKPSLATRFVSILNAAERECHRRNEEAVDTLHLFLAILDEPNSRAAGHLSYLGVTRMRATRAIGRLKSKGKIKAGKVMASATSQAHSATRSSSSGPSPKTTGKASSVSTKRTPQVVKTDGTRESANDEDGVSEALAKYTRDLTALTEQGELDPVIGRDDELRWMMQILSRRTKNNPVLIGEPGVGRTAIVNGLAARIVNGDVPEHLRQKRLMMLDFGALLAGAKFRGEFEERFKALLEEIHASAGNVILVLPDLHQLVGQGGKGGVNAANLLQPALVRGELRCIGVTTPSAYRQQIEKDAALKRLFQAIRVEQPGQDECIAILRGLKSRYEIHHGVRITDAALRSAVALAMRYVADRALPDIAIDLIDEAASRLRLAIDAMPPGLDDINRKIIQLKIEEQALLRETSEVGRKQLSLIRDEIARWQGDFSKLKVQWDREKRAIVDIRVLKEQIATHEQEEQDAERNGDFQRAADLKYGVLNRLYQQLQESEQVFVEAGENRLLKEEVDEEEVAGVIADWTGIPVAKMMEGERDKLLRMEERLQERVVGQPEAIGAIAEAIRRSRSGLSDPNRPIGSFLFLGPTGVGKTELAKALASFLFDDERAMIRIDMSEFMEKHAVTRLVGSPPGYVGHEEGGQLTEAVRTRPYSVVLFDEIEKAHVDVFNLLLQLLDDGHLSDSQGRMVDFKNTVIILTSNIGASAILDDALDDQPEAIRASIQEALQAHFRPEFLNRIDETLIFNRLSFEVIQVILEIQLRKLQKLLAAHQLSMELTDAAKEHLARAGYDPAFGARPLKRAVLQLVQNPLSMDILEGTFPPHSVILADVASDQLVFSRKS